MAVRPNPRLVLPVVVVAAVLGGIYWLTTSLGDDDRLTAAGTVEAEEIRVAPEVPGRIVAVLVEEGDAVAAGDRLVVLDDTLLRAQRERAQAAVAAAEQALAAAELNLLAADLQEQQADAAARAQDRARQQLAWQLEAPADVDLPPWYLTPDEMLAAAEAEVEAAQRALDEAQRRLDSLLASSAHAEVRQAELRLRAAQAAFVAADAVFQRALSARQSADLYDEASAARERARDERDAAQEAFDELLGDERHGAVRRARAALAVAEARRTAAEAQRDGWRTGPRSIEVALAGVRLRQAEAARAQAAAALEQARAELAAIEVQLDRTVLRSPVDGVVLTRSASPGEVLPAGAVALSLGVLDDLTMTVFLPEDRYGQVGLGDEVVIEVDSFPGETFRGRVLRIADRAEFTPRNVQTEEGRRTTVFAVAIAIDDPSGRLKPGMPADVTFGAGP